ncbi:MAG TPA: HAD-IIIC family phosphatase [Terracidiphilus sp.]|nr:HAD-IIIC family phosphatase [Terracidiphilus sp.]
MKLIDALKLVALPVEEDAPEKRVCLACGFTPLHLQTFLTASLKSQLPGHRVIVKNGLFGDLSGNVERFQSQKDAFDSLVVLIEWSDLDPRLGVRTLGGWHPSQMAEIVGSARQMAARLQKGIVEASRLVRVVVSMPTLPLPPLFTTMPIEASPAETELRHVVASLAAALVQEPGIRVVSGQSLNCRSTVEERYDVKSDVATGFPYQISHASVLAEILSELICDRPKKKGLITDLDDTLWSGILGEDGPDGISWHLDRHSQLHGLYQQFLASLAGAGVLIGVASKNDLVNVERAFERADLLISKNEIFPIEAHWSRKSESVERILKAWNVAPDSVVFIDDSPMEVAEVQAVYPEMVCKIFPKNDYAGTWKFLKDLRELFGKFVVTEDDAIRLQSIRESSAWREANGNSLEMAEEFLRTAEARVTIEPAQDWTEARAFELLNKTNQFNLNGRRLNQAEWSSFFQMPGSFVFTVSYKDKFGALGKVAVMMGQAAGERLTVTNWVLSCRAFSRRIEHQCVKYLFDAFGVNEIFFDFESTPRNAVLRTFLTELIGEQFQEKVSLSKEQFAAKAPRLFHTVEGIVHV